MPQDADRARQLLETILRDRRSLPSAQAVEAAVFGERVLDADGWDQLTPVQQAFVAETRGLPAERRSFWPARPRPRAAARQPCSAFS